MPESKRYPFELSYNVEECTGINKVELSDKAFKVYVVNRTCHSSNGTIYLPIAWTAPWLLEMSRVWCWPRTRVSTLLATKESDLTIFTFFLETRRVGFSPLKNLFIRDVGTFLGVCSLNWGNILSYILIFNSNLFPHLAHHEIRVEAVILVNIYPLKTLNHDYII